MFQNQTVFPWILPQLLINPSFADKKVSTGYFTLSGSNKRTFFKPSIMHPVENLIGAKLR